MFKVKQKSLKFTMISFTSFIIDYLLFSAMVLIFGAEPAAILTANILARVISAAYNYLMNCRLVFRQKPSPSSAADYFLLAVFILCMNNILLELLVAKIGIISYIAKLMTEMTLFIMSFMIQNFLIFRKRKAGETYV